MNPTVREVDIAGMRGVHSFNLPVIRDERGWVQELSTYGFTHRPVREVYGSGIRYGVVKGWHMHTKMTLCYVCVMGEVVVGLHDPRQLANGETPISVMVHLAAEGDDYCALVIPPFVWNGFRIPLQSHFQKAMIINSSDLEHDPEEIRRIAPDAIPGFDWGLYTVGG